MVLCQNNRSQVRDISCNLINPIGEALYSFWGRRKAHLEVSQQRNIFSRIKKNELEQHADELETFGNKHFSKENTFFFLKQLFAFRMEQKIILNMWVLLQWQSCCLCNSNWATWH